MKNTGNSPYKTSNKRGILTVNQGVYLGNLYIKLLARKYKKFFSMIRGIYKNGK